MSSSVMGRKLKRSDSEMSLSSVSLLLSTPKPSQFTFYIDKLARVYIKLN